MALSIIRLGITLIKCDTQHKDKWHLALLCFYCNAECHCIATFIVVLLSVVLLSVILLSVVLLSDVLLSDVLLSDVLLSDVLLSGVLLSGVLLSVVLLSVVLLSVCLLSNVLQSVVLLAPYDKLCYISDPLKVEIIPLDIYHSLQREENDTLESEWRKYIFWL